MKIGLFYEDKNTGELFMCDNFTKSTYVWINKKGESITEDKWDSAKHMNLVACKDNQKIKNFLDDLTYKVMGLCETCNKTFVSNFRKYINEIANGDELCPICGKRLWY
ncbi:hypothetical protein [Clostridium brassicae]|uniref:Uncharacterized protein n=1 Tax=Clostridium brassicae TaxID=2999072 RepID=A0ABT4D6F5_9CLOT|nr:hypothetical protein [Clostridium brassicae]MCY6957880.1 hypothetical protein [Clostridium brassicae]